MDDAQYLEYLHKEINNFRNVVCADAKASVRVKAVNTMLNSGHKLELLHKRHLETIWDSIFYAFWHSEMGKGCEDIIAATVRGCENRLELTQIGFKKLSRTWLGLDQYRVDKFSHLARHLTAKLIEIQIKMWFMARTTYEGFGLKRPCKLILYDFLDVISNSMGLLYFVLDIFVEELRKTLDTFYIEKNVYIGNSKFKSDLLSFIYKQFVMFTVDQKYDFRLMSTIDLGIFQKFITTHLANESQKTQIHVIPSIKKILDRYTEPRKKSKDISLNRKTEKLICKWSNILSTINDSCIDGYYFVESDIPEPVNIEIPKDVKNTRNVSPE